MGLLNQVGRLGQKPNSKINTERQKKLSNDKKISTYIKLLSLIDNSFVKVYRDDLFETFNMYHRVSNLVNLYGNNKNYGAKSNRTKY